MSAENQEELRQLAQTLMEHRWVTRKEMPEEYLRIRRNEKILRRFFREKCGWPLLVTAKFYKLEKIPSHPESFMGIPAMRSVEDYTLLACVMAFLEDYEAGSQFLLGELAEALPSYYPEDAPTSKLDWTDYGWRKALIRVMNYLAEENILRVVDDESDAFLTGGISTEGVMAGEALYEVTVLARYFLRAFPRELQTYHSLEELENADFLMETTEEAKALRRKRNQIYRELLLKPVIYRPQVPDAKDAYLSNMKGTLSSTLEEWFDLHLELYQNAVMAVSREPSSWFSDIFPVRLRGIHEIILHLSHYLRQLPKENRTHPLTKNEWKEHLEELAKKTGKGWTKEFREMSRDRLSETLLSEMTSWGMVCQEEDGLITLLPALFRLQGTYQEEEKKSEE